jgi:DNA-binding MarR family transcriptional regulator
MTTCEPAARARSASWRWRAERGGQVGHPVDDQQMALTGQQREVAAGYLGGQVFAHRRGDEGVGLALPQLNLGLDLAQGESPGPAEQDDDPSFGGGLGGSVAAGTDVSSGPPAALVSRAPELGGYILSSVNDIVGHRRPDQPPTVLERTGARVLAEGQAAAAAAELFAAMSVIRRAARRTARQAWTQQPLPPTQSELLRLAVARPGITVADAAQELRLAPNTVSTLVGRLTEAGLLVRERGAADGRTALLTATEKARLRLAEFRDLRADLAGRALAQLPEQDQKALAAAVPALLRLAGRMEGQ